MFSQKSFNKRQFVSSAFAIAASVAAVAGFVYGATTIGTNISIDGNLTVSGTSATSTFSAGGFTVGTNQFVVQQTSGNVGIGTSTPRTKVDLIATALTGPEGPKTLPGGLLVQYGKDEGTTFAGFEDYTLDQPILTLRTPDGLVKTNSGINTALLIEGHPWVRNQATGIAIELGRKTMSSRIVHFGDNANTNWSGLQLQANFPNFSSTWTPGVFISGTGAVMVGYGGSNQGAPPSDALFAIYATTTNAGGGFTSVASAFEVIGTNNSTSLLKLANSGVLTVSSFAVSTTTATSTFSTGGLTVGTSQFVVQQTSGNVGIGTTSPSQLLSVAGDAYIAGAGTTTLSLKTTTASRGTCLEMFDGAGAVYRVFVSTGGVLTVAAGTCK